MLYVLLYKHFTARCTCFGTIAASTVQVLTWDQPKYGRPSQNLVAVDKESERWWHAWYCAVPGRSISTAILSNSLLQREPSDCFIARLSYIIYTHWTRWCIEADNTSPRLSPDSWRCDDAKDPASANAPLPPKNLNYTANCIRMKGSERFPKSSTPSVLTAQTNRSCRI